MTEKSVPNVPAKPAGRRSFLDRLRRDENGFTAVEFALVATPFLALLFGIIAVGLYFFVQFSLENAVEQASRLIRTGQAQTREPPMTTAQFKTEICNRAPSFIDCGGKVRVNVQVFNSFSAVTSPSCTDNGGNLIPDPPVSNVPGQAGEIVFVNVCYEWELAGKIPFLKLGKLGNGAALIQAATTFRTEPYN
ncbi:MAG: TadE/TadG family type IV pilus assembly protein [Hyphomicrobiaceae bacterium]